VTTSEAEMEEIKHGNKKQARLHFLFDHFDRGMEKVDKTDSNFPVEKMGSFFVSHFSSNKYGKRIILKTFLTHQPLPS